MPRPRYDAADLGPALQRMRKVRGLVQKEVAKRMERPVQMVSRIEQRGANPRMSTLGAYLDAIGGSLTELHEEMSEVAAKRGGAGL